MGMYSSALFYIQYQVTCVCIMSSDTAFCSSLAAVNKDKFFKLYFSYVHVGELTCNIELFQLVEITPKITLPLGRNRRFISISIRKQNANNITIYKHHFSGC